MGCRMMAAMPEPHRWLDSTEAAAHVGLREMEFLRRVKAARLPAPSYQLGARTPRWDRAALDATMTGGPTSQPRPLSGAINAVLAAGREKAAGRRHGQNLHLRPQGAAIALRR